MSSSSKSSVRRVQELRRSSAASPQDTKHELTNKEAIKEQMDDIPCGSDFCCGGEDAEKDTSKNG
jgi:hypothetical protein